METKFQLGDMLMIALTLVVAGIGISYGLQVTGEIAVDNCEFDDGTQCTNSTGGTSGVPLTSEYNASVDTIEAAGKISSKMPLIATVVVAALIIGILLRYLAVPNMK